MKTKSNEPLAPYTTFGIGGRAETLYEPASYDELEAISETNNDLLKEAHFIGRGSNLLVEEGLIEKPLIRLRGEFKNYQFQGNTVRAGAAVMMPELSIEAARNDLSGLEWAAGVPGTVGGAVAMNAGAYDGETFDNLGEIEVLTRNSVRKTIQAEELETGYRSCELRGEALVLEANFEFEQSADRDSTKTTQKLLNDRRSNQPVGRKSAGCIFRNVDGHSAGQLIDKAGLKGTSEGAVEVSEEHANYFINRGGGTFEDVMNLIDRVRNEVLNTHDVELPLEVQIVRSKS